jgi:hypothetical protein
VKTTTAVKPEIPPAIVDPCPLSWNGMEGGDRRRFCEQCQLHVHNLSEMNDRERKTLLTTGGHVCVTYFVDAAGHMITRARHHWLSGFLLRTRTAAFALLASILPLGTSCAARQLMGKPMPPRDTVQPTPTPPPPKPVVPGGIELPPPSPTPAQP